MGDVFLSGKLLLTEVEITAFLNTLQNDIKMQRARPLQMVGNRNKSEGEAFLAGNKAKADVVLLDSGVQYKVLTEGKGACPGAEDTVTCHFRGLHLDGTEFDNTYRRGQPATLSLKQTIAGLREALTRMPAGSKWQIWVPYTLAYGEKGSTPKIQPYATLMFELELIASKA
jgi:FKBP-type peptidyl-prolyl cis-trans isomerase FklB